MRDEEIRDLFEGYGHEPLFIEGEDPKEMHAKMVDALDVALASIRSIQQRARDGRTHSERPRWPMIVLRSPKGWTGPKEIDGLKVEGFWRAHQVPITHPRESPAHLQLLEAWMRSYAPEELFDFSGKLIPELQALAPKGDRRMGAKWRSPQALATSALWVQMRPPQTGSMRCSRRPSGSGWSQSNPMTSISRRTVASWKC